MLEVLARNFYELCTTSVTLPCWKGFVASQPRSYINQATIFFTWKIKCQLKVIGTLVSSSVDWGKGELEVVLYGSQNVSDLMFKKNLLLLITKLVVILNHLRVINLWRPHYITNCVTPNSLHLQNWTIDLLLKSKKEL